MCIGVVTSSRYSIEASSADRRLGIPPILAYRSTCDPSRMPEEPSPKDRFVTVYGRKPVLEALADRDLDVDKVVLADSARGAAAAEILRAARDRGVRDRTGRGLGVRAGRRDRWRRRGRPPARAGLAGHSDVRWRGVAQRGQRGRRALLRPRPASYENGQLNGKPNSTVSSASVERT